ncbi:MAG TPA: WG repeat-containing protein, partial [Smithellaceae bacterium]|nr:WG repeat-containing protein [Smithellaceae bacterium]
MNVKIFSLHALILLLLCPVLLFSQSHLSLAPYRKGNHWGYANPKTGKIVVPPDLDSVGLFRREEWYDNPVAWVKKDGRYGLINTSGKVILPIQEKEIASF